MWRGQKMMKGMVAVGIFLIFVPVGLAQTSTNYQIEQGTFNNGGNPAPELTSPDFRLTLDAIGDGLAATGLFSGSYGMDSGFPPAYVPPGEVLNLRFTSKTQFGWNPEASVGHYNTYRGALGSFTGYGSCLHSGMTVTSDEDTQIPGAGTGYFYLVTVENRLNEEGTTGNDSSGTPHSNPNPCP
jgi:hypothetical protein